jgi:hypothetical protein
MSQVRKLLVGSLVVTAAITAGCKDDDKSKGNGTPQGASSGGTGNTQVTPATTPAAGHHNRIPLGEKTVDGLKLIATMDEAVKPGGEGAFDLVITGGKPKAVRFWVGTENAEGSVMAKADEETTDNWHTHAEVPNPIPPGSKFWAEVEPPTGETFKVSFDLKVQ